MTPGYVGRFAPSPTGLLHAGSLVAALASWLDARAHQGRWLVRIEDVDGPRCVPGADQAILGQLARCGLLPDEAPWWQSRRGEAYEAALTQLRMTGDAYPCACTRKEIEEALRRAGVDRQRHHVAPYPGTCRPERGGLAGRPARAWRLRVPDGAAALVDWTDRRLGAQHQDLAHEVGDVVLRRADGLWAYQLAVVVDDAAQGVTDVVRGEDLADNTPRQIRLQACLGLRHPRWLHTPLVKAADGEKLSKQNGAAEVDLGDPLAALRAAATHLGLPELPGATLGEWQAAAVAAWRAAWVRAR